MILRVLLCLFLFFSIGSSIIWSSSDTRTSTATNTIGFTGGDWTVNNGVATPAWLPSKIFAMFRFGWTVGVTLLPDGATITQIGVTVRAKNEASTCTFINQVYAGIAGGPTSDGKSGSSSTINTGALTNTYRTFIYLGSLTGYWGFDSGEVSVTQLRDQNFGFGVTVSLSNNCNRGSVALQTTAIMRVDFTFDSDLLNISPTSEDCANSNGILSCGGKSLQIRLTGNPTIIGASNQTIAQFVRGSTTVFATVLSWAFGSSPATLTFVTPTTLTPGTWTVRFTFNGGSQWSTNSANYQVVGTCSPTNCNGRGTCDTNTGLCSCSTGWSGSGCQSDVDECSTQKTACTNANCVNSQGSYSCTCFSGYTSVSATVCQDINECNTISGVCANGTCLNSPGSYSCTCNNGFAVSNGGQQCVDIDECANNPCSNSTCRNFPGGYACDCWPGYSQASVNRCVDIDECLTNPCKNGTCTNFLSGFYCLCNTGFEPINGDASNCRDINECLNSPCVNANCLNSPGGFSCTCLGGYRSTPNPWVCEVNANACDNNKCINSACSPSVPPLNYNCTCNPGYSRVNATFCQDINECNNPSACTNAFCVNTPGSFSCQCFQGYTKMSNTVCNDINECAESNPCVLANCTNSPGNHSCTCFPGYQKTAGSSDICEDIPNCLANPCRNATCIELPGSYSCQCLNGYKKTADPNVCIDIDNCASNPCKNATCVNFLGNSYACDCLPGFEYGPIKDVCVDIDECQIPGQCVGGVCTNFVGYFHCNYTYNVSVCTNCNGTCDSLGNCVCPIGTIPPLCLPAPPPNCTDVNDCSGNHSLICISDNACICKSEWTGIDCNTPVCKDTCQNGFCVAPDRCECESEWRGVLCEIPVVAAQEEIPLVGSSSNLPIVLGSLGGGLGFCAILMVIFIIVGKKKGVFNKSRRPRAVEPKYKLLIFGDYLSKSPGSHKPFDAFEQMLMTAPFNLLRVGVETVPVSEQDKLAQNTAYLSESRGMSVDVIKFFISEEIKHSDNENTLFRANSFSTKLFKTYSKMIGLQYLFSTLAESLTSLEHQIKESQISMEVDPNKIEAGTDVMENAWQLLLITQKIFTSITRSVPLIPKPLLTISFHLQKEVQKKYQGSENKMLGAFWFLRLYCPALVAPHVYGLTQTPPGETMQRQLVLLGKILQNLANGVQFGAKEKGMEKLNEFMIENQENLRNFYAKLMVDHVMLRGDAVQVPNKVKENALAHLYQFFESNKEKIAEELDQKSKAEFLKIMSDLQ